MTYFPRAEAFLSIIRYCNLYRCIQHSTVMDGSFPEMVGTVRALGKERKEEFEKTSVWVNTETREAKKT